MIQAIIYTSNTGHTEAYAKLLGEKTSLPVYPLDKAGKNLPKRSEVIYLGWLFASSIKGYAKAAKRYTVRCVCGVGLGDTGAQDKAARETSKVPDDIPVFTLQGGMDYPRLKGVNKFMIDMLAQSLVNKADRTEDETIMLELIKTGGDYVDEAHLSAVLAWYEERKDI